MVQQPGYSGSEVGLFRQVRIITDITPHDRETQDPGALPIEDQTVAAPAMVMDYPEDLPQSENELSDESESQRDEVRSIGASLAVPIDYDNPLTLPQQSQLPMTEG